MIRAPQQAPERVPDRTIEPEDQVRLRSEEERLPEPTPESPIRDWPTVLTTGLSVLLAVSSAAWMTAGVFRGWSPKAVAVLGALIGVGLTTYSFRLRRPSVLQYLVVPAAMVVGAALTAIDPRAVESLPRLVQEAVRTGGLAQPPIAFDPGWKFILIVLTAALGAGAVAVAAWLQRPRLGVFMPLPLLFATALIQPREIAVAQSAVSLVLLVGSLAVSYGVELMGEGASSSGFEARRYARGAIGLGALVVVVILISRAGFLFPTQEAEQVIPPKKPEAQPIQADRVLFTVESDRPGPWRLGVLDGYADDGWLLPPFDLGRLEKIPGSGEIPGHPAAPASAEGTTEATFTINDISGDVIPSVASPTRLTGASGEARFDPRTQTLRLTEGRPPSGFSYTIEAPVAPTGEQLASAPAPPEEMEVYLDAPLPPNEVVTLLAEAPSTNSWDRLQYVRNTFYQSVIAAGPGEPTNVPPSRVVEMLEGGEASPYELTAAEALLARWAGVPSRLGYGYYQGEEEADPGVWEVHPKHGRTWLEAYFEGHGWVPVVGTPPRARPSLAEQERTTDPSIRPSEELALIVYVPVRLQTIRLLYVTVRYWLLVALPFVAGGLFVIGFYPWVLKMARRLRRRRWTAGRLRRRIAVAYCNFRDAAGDLNIGDPSATPLGFVDSVDEDPEHFELAWLVTRSMWGDLSRDIRIEDAEAATEMAASVTKRLRKAQPALTRLISLGSRASLRDPYSSEMPNMWPRWARKGLVRSYLLVLAAPLRRPFRALRRLLPTGALLMVLITVAACARPEPPEALAADSFPETIAPAEFQGFTIQREGSAEESFERVDPEDSLITQGRVFTVRRGGEVLASLQAAEFKPGLGASRREVRQGVLDSLGAGGFELRRVGGEGMYVREGAEQIFYLWFAPSGSYYQLLVARRGFEEAGQMFSSLIREQRGDEEAAFAGVPVQPADPRRGEEG